MIRYAITDRRMGLSSSEGHPADALAGVLQRCERLVPGRLDGVIIREKDLAAATLLALTRATVACFSETSTHILVARRLDIACAAGAHGVHLTSSIGELTPAEVRAVFPRASITRSCHSLDEVRSAARAGVDTILFGPVFSKVIRGVEVSPGVGLSALKLACAAADGVPVLALGGVTQQNAAECVSAGAAGIASIRMFFG